MAKVKGNFPLEIMREFNEGTKQKRTRNVSRIQGQK